MASKMNRNVEGLARHAEQKRLHAEEKANRAIDVLKQKHRKINFKTVSEESGVSKATLYKNSKLRKRIESLRAVCVDREEQRKTEGTRLSQEETLRAQITTLKEEKKMLIEQLVEMDKVKQENQHLKKLLASRKLE